MPAASPKTFDPFTACLYCGGTRFHDGPRGGCCMNITCVECGAQFNIVLWPGLPQLLVNVLSGPAMEHD